MKIHFIAIGGSIMHSLAIALKQAGHAISGSDDGLYDPAKSRLEAHGLLPRYEGWNPTTITPDLDAVILGMHAFEDNPELKAAQALGLPIYSFPEFIFQQSLHKQRIVIAGSYGKTTVTAMIMHVLEACGKSFDYLVGAQVKGFDNPVRLSADAPVILVEGDEYLASRIDKRPKFLLYHPHVVVINGISWDHINVFPTEDEYVDQFSQLLASLSKGADIIYTHSDKRVKTLVKQHEDESYYLHPFKTPSYKSHADGWEVKIGGASGKVKVIGKHNMDNIHAAWEVCELMGIELSDFLQHIGTFEGAGMRMEKLYEDDTLVLIRDYAHAPEKVHATVEAVSEAYKGWNLIACSELHTFSSLNREFLPLYKKSMKAADKSVVFVNPDQYTKRRMEPLSAEEIQAAFDQRSLEFVEDPKRLIGEIRKHKTGKDVILMMSSGNFAQQDLMDLK